MEAVVITLRARKPAERRGKILFINAVNEYARESAQSFLRERHQQRIWSGYQKFIDEPGFAAVAALDDVAAKGYNLAIPQYVTRPARTVEGEDRLTVTDALSTWHDAADAAHRAIAMVLDLLRREAAR